MTAEPLTDAPGRATAPAGAPGHEPLPDRATARTGTPVRTTTPDHGPAPDHGTTPSQGPAPDHGAVPADAPDRADAPYPEAAPTDPRRARGNQLTRAAQWFAGTLNDPYGLILRSGTEDPRPHEERVRAEGPLFHSAPLDTWVTADRAVAEAVVADPAFDGPRPGPEAAAGDGLPYRSAVLAVDRETAARLAPLTALGGPMLWAPEEECVEKRTVTLARALLSGLGDRFDLAEDFARPLVGRVIGEQLGLPEAAHERFVRVLPDCRHALDGLLCPQPHAVVRAAERAEAALSAVLAEGLHEAGADSVRAARILAVGAAETTVVLVANAVRRLLAEPGAWQRLAADPALAAGAVQDTLRLAPPVRLETRTARADTVLAGTELPAGSRVTLLVAAVNRDPAAPADAAPFGLPGDLHFALSGRLVTVIARAALGALAGALPALRTAGEEVTRPRSPVLAAPARLPVARTA
ncbi:cytochrome P450 [Streptomyces sp. bgisy095]|uniref:cytochrome P450 n=1 Tax=unclassified Streptomyces TaxID=2593676 RepID=UPI003D73A50F